jgi:PAS domain S-box-containing protein
MPNVEAPTRSFRSEPPNRFPVIERTHTWGRLFLPIVFLTLALSLITLAGWLVDIESLKSFVPESSPMSSNSAFLLCLVCLSLIPLQSRKRAGRYLGSLAALCVLIVGLLTLAEYLFGFNLGIDGRGQPFHSLRMSPISAVNFFLIGLALFLLWISPTERTVCIQILAVTASIVALFNIVGYLYSVTVFYHISPYKPISIRSSICFGSAVVAILLARPGEGLMGLILEESYGGLIIRRFLLFVLIIPVLLGGLACLVIQSGLFAEPHAILVLVVLTIFAFMILLLVNGRTISRTESEKKKAEGEFRRIESNYRELFENIGNAVCICEHSENGNDFLILDINKAAERVEGINKEEALGKSIRRVIPMMEDFGIFEVIKGVWATGQPEFSEHSLGRSEADTLWRKSRIYKLPSGEVVTIYDDITERKRAEREKEMLRYQLFQAQKMEAIGRLAGGIAHDFNNFLTIIAGYCDLLFDNSRLSNPERDDLAEIKNAAQSASALIHQLLAFSRKQLLQPEVLNINGIISNIKNMLKTLLSEKIELVLKLDQELRSVEVDPSQIIQVIMNLAVNARDAMQNGGVIIIETGNVTVSREYSAIHVDIDPGEYVLLEVIDTGIGMDGETLSRVFEPFFTTKDLGKGTGLGLSTVYGIIKQSGGAIYPYSEPGKGTTFKIYLPAVVNKQPSKQKSTGDETLPPGSESILLVEDDPALRAFVKRILDKNGYAVLDAGDGETALRIAEEHGLRLDLLITDIIMPKMNGRELSELLQGLCPDITVLYISGYTEDCLGENGILDQQIHFLRKPFNAGTMLTKIRHVLDTKADAKKAAESGVR